MRCLVAAALLLAGCYDDTCDPRYCADPSANADVWLEGHRQSTLALDPQLSVEEQAAAVAAAQSWHTAVGTVQITLVPGEITDSFVVRRALPGELKDNWLASTHDSVIAISPELKDSGYLQGALAHEFGHYLGLGHEPDLPDDIMYPCTHEGMPSAPTPDAVRDLRALYGLP